MENKPVPICSSHQRPKEWRQATFEYSEDGVSVRVPGVYAWVCPEDGEVSFTPETVDELITTVRELLEPAKRARAALRPDRIYRFCFIRRSDQASRLRCASILTLLRPDFHSHSAAT